MAAGLELGLAQSRGLTEAMRGTLNPEGPRGRTHHGAVSAGRTPAVGSSHAGGAWAPGKGVEMTCVLVVDDEPRMLRALAISLRAHHYQVVVAASGGDALTTAAAHNPDELTT